MLLLNPFRFISKVFSTGTYGFNPVNKTFATFSDNNRTVTSVSTTTATTYTIPLAKFPTNYGKYQIELLINSRAGTGGLTIGMSHDDGSSVNVLGLTWTYTGTVTSYLYSTSTVHVTDDPAYAFVAGDILGICSNTETGDVTLYKNGVLVGTLAALLLRGTLIHSGPRVVVASSGAQNPSSVTFIDGSLGFNYPVSGFEPITPLKTDVKFDPAKTEADTFTLMDDTALYHLDGTANYHTAVANTGYSSGKHVFYWLAGGYSTNDKFGIATSTFDITATNGLATSGVTGADSVALSRGAGSASASFSLNNAGTVTTVSITATSNNQSFDEWAMAVDLDASPQKAHVYRNGVLLGSHNLPSGKTWYAAASVNQQNAFQLFNFGQIRPRYQIQGYLNWDEAIPVYPNPEDPLADKVIFRHTFDGTLIRDKKGAEISSIGTPTLSTSVLKFGYSSLAFLSAGAAQNVNSGSTQVFKGTEDYAIEFWVRPSTLSPTPEAIIFNTNSGTSGFRLSWDNQTTLTLKPNGTAFTAISSGTVSADTWYFVQIVRQSNVIYLHVDGVNQGSSTYTESHLGTGFQLGTDSAQTAASAFKGYIDDFRFTKGAARAANLPTTRMPIY